MQRRSERRVTSLSSRDITQGNSHCIRYESLHFRILGAFYQLIPIVTAASRMFPDNSICEYWCNTNVSANLSLFNLMQGYEFSTRDHRHPLGRTKTPITFFMNSPSFILLTQGI